MANPVTEEGSNDMTIWRRRHMLPASGRGTVFHGGGPDAGSRTKVAADSGLSYR